MSDAESDASKIDWTDFQKEIDDAHKHKKNDKKRMVKL